MDFTLSDSLQMALPVSKTERVYRQGIPSPRVNEKTVSRVYRMWQHQEKICCYWHKMTVMSLGTIDTYKGPVEESAIPARKRLRSDGYRKWASTLPAPADLTKNDVQRVNYIEAGINWLPAPKSSPRKFWYGQRCEILKRHVKIDTLSLGRLRMQQYYPVRR